jgi:hypothetical protein
LCTASWTYGPLSKVNLDPFITLNLQLDHLFLRFMLKFVSFSVFFFNKQNIVRFLFWNLSTYHLAPVCVPQVGNHCFRASSTSGFQISDFRDFNTKVLKVLKRAPSDAVKIFFKLHKAFGSYGIEIQHIENHFITLLLQRITKIKIYNTDTVLNYFSLLIIVIILNRNVCLHIFKIILELWKEKQ